MTVAELEAELARLKVQAGKWKAGEPGKELPAGKAFAAETKILEQVATLLEGELVKDRDRLADLHIALAKAKHGGGQ